MTLEDDLARRDLTINAIAQDEDGTLIDPHGGRRDLADKVLRHVSPAFAEDPVRILRLARFAARFADFRVAAETEALMREMVRAGEVDALVPERVWQEVSRGLMEAKPSRMFEVLRGCGALARVLPEVDRLFGVPQRADHHPEVDTGVHLMMVLDMAARLEASLAVRYACLGHDLGKGTTPAEILPQHISPRGAQRRAGARDERAAARRQRVSRAGDRRRARARQRPSQRRVRRRRDRSAARALRRAAPARSLRRGCCSRASATRAAARGLEDAPYPPRARLSAALGRVTAVDATAVAEDAAARGLTGPAIGAAIHDARVRAVARTRRRRRQPLPGGDDLRGDSRTPAPRALQPVAPIAAGEADRRERSALGKREHLEQLAHLVLVDELQRIDARCARRPRRAARRCRS